MRSISLGNTSLQVSPLAFGGNVFGWTADEAMSCKLCDAWLDAGLNFIDTADVYSRFAPGNQGGESETLLGKWFKRSGRRNDVVLASKVGMEMGPGMRGLSKAHIIAAVDRSLQRLQTDCIDLYQAHTDDAETPLEETLGAFDTLVSQGKVRAIGASNYTAPRLDAALTTSHTHNFPAYSTLQPLYNLYDRADFEASLAPLCLKAGLGVIPYFSLASGFLTGKYRSEANLANSKRAMIVKKYLTPRGFAILDALDAVASEHDATPAQVSLAWLMARPGVTAPIVSATSIEQLTDIIRSVDLRLTAEQMKQLNDASQPK